MTDAEQDAALRCILGALARWRHDAAVRMAAAHAVERIVELEETLRGLRRECSELCARWWRPDRICSCGAKQHNEQIDQALQGR